LKKSFRFCFSFKRLKEMLYFSTPLVISGIAVWGSLYIDRMMINYFLSIEEVGLYAIGLRVSSIALLAISGIQLSLTPLIYKHYNQPDTPRQLDIIFRLVIFFSLIMFLFLSFFSLDILKIMTTPEFYGASTLLIFLVPAFLLRSMYIFSPGIAIAKKTHLIIWINVAGGLLNFLLNYWFIPLFGITGAAIATMISYASFFLAYMLIGQLFYPIPYQWKRILASAIFVSLFVLLFQLISLPDITRRFANLFAIILFTLIAIKIRLVTLKEILNILGFLRSNIFSLRR
jgi:O-antigen/teichoic acid export membrane protein